MRSESAALFFALTRLVYVIYAFFLLAMLNIVDTSRPVYYWAEMINDTMCEMFNHI